MDAEARREAVFAESGVNTWVDVDLPWFVRSLLEEVMGDPKVSSEPATATCTGTYSHNLLFFLKNISWGCPGGSVGWASDC